MQCKLFRRTECNSLKYSKHKQCQRETNSFGLLLFTNFSFIYEILTLWERLLHYKTGLLSPLVWCLSTLPAPSTPSAIKSFEKQELFLIDCKHYITPIYIRIRTNRNGEQTLILNLHFLRENTNKKQEGK